MTTRKVPAVAETSSKRKSKMPVQTQSLNHLLNFSLPPRQTPPSLPRRAKKSAASQTILTKERFLNAQYRFVMNPSGDYTVHFADPDIYFNWQDILQVVLPRSSPIASASSGTGSTQAEHICCPICLSPPTAPRMTKCGHVYCFPCILHYLATSENKWARCPICFDSITERFLKAVKWFDPPTFADISLDNPTTESSSSSSSTLGQEAAPKAGSLLRLRLIQRPQITTLALPRSTTWPSDLIPPHQAPFHFLPDIFEYAKFMLATPEYLIADLNSELEQLATERRVLGGMNDELSLHFIDGAMQKIRHQIEKAEALENTLLRGRIDKAHRDLQDIRSRHEFQQERLREDQNRAHTDDVPEDLLSVTSMTPHDLIRASTPTRGASRHRRNVNPPPPSTSTYYFYQAASGLPVFLHPLDIRILLSHFNSYSAFPDTIDIRVDAVSEGTVNDDLRKRCKYLAHLPEGADVAFIEADLAQVVSAECLKNFEAPLKSRLARRKDKAKKEDRARARAEEREREKERQQRTSTWHTSNAPVSDVFEDAGAGSPDIPDESPSQAQGLSGAWGSRSFASAIGSNRASPARPPPPEIDEWDVDAAWHEMEMRNGPGRRKRSNKLVVLGGSGARRR